MIALQYWCDFIPQDEAATGVPVCRPLGPPRASPRPTPPGRLPRVTQQTPSGCPSYTCWCLCGPAALSVSPLPPPWPVRKSVSVPHPVCKSVCLCLTLSVSLSVPHAVRKSVPVRASKAAPQVAASLPSFWVPYLCVKIQYLFFSF